MLRDEHPNKYYGGLLISVSATADPNAGDSDICFMLTDWASGTDYCREVFNTVHGAFRLVDLLVPLLA